MPRRQPSQHINRKAAARLHHACRYLDIASGRAVGAEKLSEQARSRSVDLTFFVTINYANTALGDRFDELRSRRFTPWLRRQCASLGLAVEPTYVWVRENKDGIEHVHWALHIPTALQDAFRTMLPRWVASLDQQTAGRSKRSSGFGPAPEAVVQIKPVSDTVGLRKYLLKGVSEVTKRFFGIKEVSDQGVVVKRRSGYSRNLCPKAIRRMGYTSRRVPPNVSQSVRAWRLAKHLAGPKQGSARPQQFDPAKVNATPNRRLDPTRAAGP